MSELSRFQDAFMAALGGDEAAVAPWLTPGGPSGLLVYRNTVAKGAVDALAASFPTVQRLVGEAWFRAAAREFAAERPPSESALLTYGADFPAWLAAFPPAASMPFLAAAARLDRLWSEAHLAPDAPPLEASAFASLNAAALERTAAVLHPSARLARFEDNAGSLWLANRPPAEPPETFALADGPEGVVLVRKQGVVEAWRVEPPALAFLSASAARRPLAEAAATALATGEAALAAIVGWALEAQLFTRLEPVEGEPS